MTRRIAVYGGSFNPPCVHHRAMVQALADAFDEVVVVPCGPRPDKPTTNDILPVARAAMADMTFGDLDRVRVELFDLEQAGFTRTHELVERFRDEGEIWVVVGTKLVRGGARSESFIQRTWERGVELWQHARFAVVVRQDEHLDDDDLPPNNVVLRPPTKGTSKAVREHVFHHQPIDGLVLPRVGSYIRRSGIYRGRAPVRSTTIEITHPRPLLVVDERNPQARAASSPPPA